MLYQKLESNILLEKSLGDPWGTKQKSFGLHVVNYNQSSFGGRKSWMLPKVTLNAACFCKSSQGSHPHLTPTEVCTQARGPMLSRDRTHSTNINSSGLLGGRGGQQHTAVAARAWEQDKKGQSERPGFLSAPAIVWKDSIGQNKQHEWYHPDFMTKIGDQAKPFSYVIIIFFLS